MEIFKYKDSDIEEIVDLFLDTVHEINRRDYSPEQLNVWAPINERHRLILNWAQSLKEHISYVAKIDGRLIGFADLTLDGIVDRIYVHKAFQKQKIASKLLEKLESEAYELGLNQLETDSSITALLFFTHHGFKVLHDNIIVRDGVTLHNFTMIKEL